MDLSVLLKKYLKLVRGLIVDNIYKIYYSICRKNFTRKTTYQQSNMLIDTKDKFHRQGYVKSRLDWLQDISEEVEYCFSSRKSNCLSYENSKFTIVEDWASSKYSYCYLTPDSIYSIKLIDRFLDSDDFKKCELIRSTFLKIVNVSLWKTYPNAFYNDGSFVWHRDSMPKSGIKCLYYLSNVDEESGPLVILPNTYKDNKYISGYTPSRNYELDYDHPGRIKILGTKGSGLIFDTNNLHYAGRTTSSPITIISFLLQPHHGFGKKFYYNNGSGFGPLSREFSIFPWNKWW